MATVKAHSEGRRSFVKGLVLSEGKRMGDGSADETIQMFKDILYGRRKSECEFA
jgi:hypothetical protein